MCVSGLGSANSGSVDIGDSSVLGVRGTVGLLKKGSEGSASGTKEELVNCHRNARSIVFERVVFSS